MELWLHSFDHGAIDLTKRFRRLRWDNSLDAPWGAIDVTLAIPLGEWGKRGLPPMDQRFEGDWLTVKAGGNGQLGKIEVVQNLGLMASSDGSVHSHGVRILATSWLYYLRKLNIHVASTLTSRSIGTIFTVKDWFKDLMDPLVAQMVGNMGEALEKFTRQVVTMKLPGTLGGGFLRDYIQVAKNPDDAVRVIEPVPGPRLKAILSQNFDGTGILDIMSTTFNPSPDLVELFASVENVPIAHQAIPRVLPHHMDESGAWRFVKSPLSDRWGELIKTDPRLAMMIEQTGGLPTLVYRMKPWRASDLSNFIQQNHTLARNMSDPDVGILSRPVDLAKVDEHLLKAAQQFQSGPTWKPEFGVEIFRDRIIDLTLAYGDDRRVNVVSMGLPNLPDNPIKYLESAGLPIWDEESVERHGARMISPNWGFWPNLEDRVNLIAWIRLMATFTAQLYMRQEKFGHGSALIHYREGDIPVRAGEIVTLHDGHVDGPLRVYAEEVSHTVEEHGSAGAFHASTRINFSRALRDESLRDPAPGSFVITVGTPVAEESKSEQRPIQAAKTIWFGGSEYPISWPKMNHALAHDVFVAAAKKWNKERGQRLPETLEALDSETRTRAKTGVIIHATDSGERQSAKSLIQQRAERILSGEADAQGNIRGQRNHVHFWIDVDGAIYQTADAGLRLWHSGTTLWNDHGVGIELMNLGPNRKVPLDTALSIEAQIGVSEEGFLESRPLPELPRALQGRPVMGPHVIARPKRLPVPGSTPTTPRPVVDGEPVEFDGFWGFTTAQEDALAALLAALYSALHFPVTPPVTQGSHFFESRPAWRSTGQLLTDAQIATREATIRNLRSSKLTWLGSVTDETDGNAERTAVNKIRLDTYRLRLLQQGKPLTGVPYKDVRLRYGIQSYADGNTNVQVRTETATGGHSLLKGIWHHYEIFPARTDALGIDLDAVIQKARTLVPPDPPPPPEDVPLQFLGPF